jgi:hypothetical protein
MAEMTVVYGSHARKIMWSGKMATPETLTVKVEAPPVKAEEVREYLRRNKARQEGSEPKNGHKVERKRDLTEVEKNKITNFFLSHSGKLEYDMSVAWRKANLPTDVSAFQVVGFVTTLHRAATKGTLKVKDPDGYAEFMKKHREYAARFNTPQAWVGRLEQAEVHPRFTATVSKTVAKPKRRFVA